MKYNKSEHFRVTKVVKNHVIGEFYCILNETMYDSFFAFRSAVRRFNITTKDLYDRYYKSENEDICTCGKNTKFKGVVLGYNKYCSNVCACKSSEHRLSVSNKFINNPEKLESFRNNIRESVSKHTNEERKIINEKRLKTTDEKYGENYLSERTKKQWSNKTESEKKCISKKILETRLRNGTCEHNSYACSNKKILLGNKLFFCQGYEDMILKFLYEYGFNESEILIGKDIPRTRTICNKYGYYRADIYLPKLNLLIEVKSDYTFAGNMQMYNENIQKQKDAIECGFNHVIFAIKYKPLRNDDILIFKNYIDMLISSQVPEMEKVQRLSGDAEYRPTVLGSGSARVPKKECDIVCSSQKCEAEVNTSGVI